MKITIDGKPFDFDRGTKGAKLYKAAGADPKKAALVLKRKDQADVVIDPLANINLEDGMRIATATAP